MQNSAIYKAVLAAVICGLVLSGCSSTASSSGAPQATGTGVTSDSATPTPTDAPTPTSVPALFKGTVHYTDEDKYTYDITYELDSVGKASSQSANSQPGRTEVDEPVTATLTATNTNTTGHNAPVSLSLESPAIAALYNLNRAVCQQDRSLSSTEPAQIMVQGALIGDKPLRCAVDLYNGNPGTDANAIPPGQTITYQQQPSRNSTTPTGTIAVFQILDEKALPAILADLANPPDGYILYKAQWGQNSTTSTTTVPSCYRSLGGGGSDIMILAATIPALC